MLEFLPRYITKIRSPDFLRPSCLLSVVCFLSPDKTGSYGPCSAPDGEESSVHPGLRAQQEVRASVDFVKQ